MGVESEHVPDGSAGGMADLVVGLDGSSASAAALRWAVDQIVPGRHVHAACVAAPGEAPIDESWIADALGGASAAALEVVFREGSVADELSALADEVGADAIVVGHHSHPRHGPGVVGQVTAKLLHRADRPLVVVPREWDPATTGDRPVAVGVGVSRGTEAALCWALQRPDLASRGLLLVHAYGPRSLFRPEGWLDVLAYHLDPQVLSTWVEQELLELAGQLQAEFGTDAEVSVSVRPGRAGARLVEAGASASLLVIGRSEPAFVRAHVLASYLRHAIVHAPCPVVVVPLPAE
jgi:nucleotide-binding universal stress UspA family protein